MTPADLFQIANMVPLPGWLCLALLPRWKGTQYIAAFTLPLLLALAYVLMLFPALIAGGGMEGNFTSLAGVQALFSSEGAILVGWIHYLAFDLFVGAWEVRDAQRHGVPHLLVVPCLLLTFMFGPTGLLLYFIIRTAKLRRVPPPA